MEEESAKAVQDKMSEKEKAAFNLGRDQMLREVLKELRSEEAEVFYWADWLEQRLGGGK